MRSSCSKSKRSNGFVAWRSIRFVDTSGASRLTNARGVAGSLGADPRVLSSFPQDGNAMQIDGVPSFR